MKLYYLAILDHVGRWSILEATAPRIVSHARWYALQDWQRPRIEKPSEAVEYIRAKNRALWIFESAEKRLKWAEAQKSVEALGLKQALGLVKRGKGASTTTTMETDDGNEDEARIETEAAAA